jgi:cation transport regulator ChaB
MPGGPRNTSGLRAKPFHLLAICSAQKPQRHVAAIRKDYFGGETLAVTVAWSAFELAFLCDSD